jgi:hypothetical protein
MPFTAYRSGLCRLCGRVYEAGEEITSTADHTVVPARFRHYPVCPPRPLLRVDPLAEHRDKPLRVRGTLGDGIEFDLTLSGPAADLLRVDGRGFSLRLPPAELCDQRPRPTTEPIIRRPA